MQNVSVEEFIQILADKKGRVETEMGKALAQSCALIQREAMESMRDTAIDFSKTYYTYNKTKAHHPSQAFNPPAVDTGTLRRSITYTVSETKGEVGSTLKNPPYGAYLEYGTTRNGKDTILPRPWLKPATDKNRGEIQRLLINAMIKGVSK